MGLKAGSVGLFTAAGASLLAHQHLVTGFAYIYFSDTNTHASAESAMYMYLKVFSVAHKCTFCLYGQSSSILYIHLYVHSCINLHVSLKG